MSKQSNQDRFLPCLIDRLKDNEPYKKHEVADRSVSAYEYKHSVIRDLENLLNSFTTVPPRMLEQFDEVKTSVLNYGISNVTGISLSHHNALRFEGEIRDAILAFEPRIIAETLSVNIVKEDRQSKNAFLEVHAQLWMSPYPEELHLRTSLEVDNCHIEFNI